MALLRLKADNGIRRAKPGDDVSFEECGMQFARGARTLLVKVSGEDADALFVFLQGRGLLPETAGILPALAGQPKEKAAREDGPAFRRQTRGWRDEAPGLKPLKAYVLPYPPASGQLELAGLPFFVSEDQRIGLAPLPRVQILDDGQWFEYQSRIFEQNGEHVIAFGRDHNGALYPGGLVGPAKGQADIFNDTCAKVETARDAVLLGKAT